MRTNMTVRIVGALALTMSCACGAGPSSMPASAAPAAQSGTRFGDDVAFLRQHTQLVVLQDASGSARVAVAPEFQGRVLTSSAAGLQGASFGFLNRSFIARGERVPHINVFGGEDRFWLGPEGGQYGLYFAPGASFDFAHWQTPEAIDWGAWEISQQSASEVRFTKATTLQNHSGTTFDLRVDRAVRVLERPALNHALGFELPAELGCVGFESENTIENTGATAWTKPSGLLSIWILGMFNPSPHTTIVLPFRKGPESELGRAVNDAYFGKVPADRLRIGDGVVFFRGDGALRGKIGIPRARALPIAGAYDARGRVLTLVQYTLPERATDYVNSMWEQQAEPYGGDVVNSYNDGPPEPGQPPLGPFYEIETSSPAAALAPNAKLTHVHRTLHLIGPQPALDTVARRALGTSLHEIEQALRPH